MDSVEIKWSRCYKEDLGSQDEEGFYEYAYRYFLYSFWLPDGSRLIARQYTDESARGCLFLYGPGTTQATVAPLAAIGHLVVAVVAWLEATASITQFSYFDGGYHSLAVSSLPRPVAKTLFVQVPTQD